MTRDLKRGKRDFVNFMDVFRDLPERSALIQGSGLLLARGWLRWKEDDALSERSELQHLLSGFSSRLQA